MHESPLKSLAAQSEISPDELGRQLEELSVRGKTIKDLAGDIQGARMLLKLISLGQIYKPSKEYQDNLMRIVYEHLMDPDLSAKEKALWAKVGLEANKQNSAASEQMLRLMGMWSTKSEPNVTVNVNTTIADKVLTIVDPVMGSHKRTEGDQEKLNGFARRILLGEQPSGTSSIEGSCVSAPVDAEKDS